MTVFKEDLYKSPPQPFVRIGVSGSWQVQGKIQLLGRHLSPRRTSCCCISQPALTEWRSVLVPCGELQEDSLLSRYLQRIKSNRNKMTDPWHLILSIWSDKYILRGSLTKEICKQQNNIVLIRFWATPFSGSCQRSPKWLGFPSHLFVLVVVSPYSPSPLPVQSIGKALTNSRGCLFRKNKNQWLCKMRRAGK